MTTSNRYCVPLIALAFASLFAVGSVQAADPPEPPADWFTFTYPLPISPGGYFAPTGNHPIGNINMDILADANGKPLRLLGNTALWDGAGKPTWLYLDGPMTETPWPLKESVPVVIATATPKTAMFPNGPDSGAFTSDQMKLEFVGPRTARMTYNGETFQVVNLARGLPQAAPVDLAGEWVVSNRSRYTAANEPDSQRNFAFRAKLEPTSPQNYVVATTAPSNLRLPTNGSRHYRVTCPDQNDSCSSIFHQSGPYRQVVWLDENDVGQIGSYTVAQRAMTYATVERVYFTSERGAGRTLLEKGNITGTPYYFAGEMQFVRSGTGN